MIRALWLFVCRLAVYLFLASHLYRFKSYLVNVFREPRDVGLETLLTFRHFRELTEFCGNGSRWRADGWRSLWDAVHSPEYCQRAFTGVYTVESDLDCDDHARYAVAAINHSVREGEWQSQWANPIALSVGWVDGYKPAGHMVTVVSKESDRVEMWGARFTGREYYWGDYHGLLGPFASLSQVAENVRSVYAPGSSAIGYCAHDEDLRPLEVHWGE